MIETSIIKEVKYGRRLSLWSTGGIAAGTVAWSIIAPLVGILSDPSAELEVQAVPLLLIGTLCTGVNLIPIVLAYFVQRGHNWARWIIIISAILLGIYFLMLEAGAIAGMIIFKNFIWVNVPLLFAGLSYIVFATILLFSESIQMFIIFQRTGAQAFHDWNSIAEQYKPAKEPRSSDASGILAAASRRAKFGRLVTITVFGTCSIIILALSIKAGTSINEIYSDALSVMDESEDVLAMDMPNDLGTLLFFPVIALVQGMTAIGYIITAIVTIAMVPIVLITLYTCIFILPFVITSPITTLFAFSWKDPGRVLLLRPFNRAWINRELKNLVRKEVSPFGHTYTLSDIGIRIPWMVRVPLFWGQLALFSFRIRKLKIPLNLKTLCRAMDHRIMRNLNWCLSVSKIFPVSCIESGWKATVAALVNKVDAVLVDLSHVSENIVWELQLIKRLDAINRTVFLVRSESRDNADRILRAQLGSVDKHYNVIEYDDRGVIDSEILRGALAEILS